MKASCGTREGMRTGLNSRAESIVLWNRRGGVQIEERWWELRPCHQTGPGSHGSSSPEGPPPAVRSASGWHPAAARVQPAVSTVVGPNLPYLVPNCSGWQTCQGPQSAGLPFSVLPPLLQWRAANNVHLSSPAIWTTKKFWIAPCSPAHQNTVQLSQAADGNVPSRSGDRGG